MADTGVKTTTLDPAAVLDDVIGNRDGNTVRVSVGGLAVQLAGAGAVAAGLSALAAQITGGLVSRATWADLQGTAPEADGTGGEVLDSDEGSHDQATATGYDGATVPNAGRYSWNADWARWVRIGDTGLSGRAPLDHGHDAATDETAGFMAPEDKAKLDTLKTDLGLGDISGLSAALEGKSATGHAHDAATDETAGFMSAEDKAKLDTAVQLSALSGATATVPRRLRSTAGGPVEYTSADAHAGDWQADAIYTIVFPQTCGNAPTLAIAGRATLPLLDRTGIAPVNAGDIRPSRITLWQYDTVAGGLRMLSTPHRYDTAVDFMLPTFPVRLLDEGGAADSDGLVSAYTASDPSPSSLNANNALFLWRAPAANAARPTLRITNSDGSLRTEREIRGRAGGFLFAGDLLAGGLYMLCFNPGELYFQLVGSMTERVRKDVETLSQVKRDLGDFDPVATLESPGFMSPQHVAALRFVEAQVAELNVPPTRISASNTGFSALCEAGEAVAEVFVTDATPGDSWTWAMSPVLGADNGAFTLTPGIVGGRAILGLAGAPAAGTDYSVGLRVIDSAGQFRDELFTVTARGTVGGGLHAMTEKWLAKLSTVPTGDQIAAMDRWITNAVAPIAAKIVQHWYDRWPEAQSGLVNIVAGRYNCRPSGDMSHVPLFGWMSGGMDGSLGSGWTPDADPDGFLMRNAAAWGNIVSDVAGAAYAFGCSNPQPWEGAQNRFWYVLPRTANNTALAACGHNAAGALGTGTPIPSTDARGLWLINREGLDGPTVLYRSRPYVGETEFTELFSNTIAATFPPVTEFSWCKAGSGALADPHMMNAGMILRDTLTDPEIEVIALEFALLEEAFVGATGVLTLQDNYDTATAYAVTSDVVDPAASEPRVIMRGRPNRVIAGGGGWWHPRIRIAGAQGKRPVFNFRNQEPGYPTAHLDISRPAIEGRWIDSGWFSYDQITWHKMSLPSWESGDPYKQTFFQHGTAFTQDVVYFAARPDFPAYRWQDWLDDNMASELIHATAQSLTPGAADHQKFAIANTTPFTDTIGRGVGSYPVHLFELRDDSLSNPDESPKRIVFLTCGMHPGECQHSWNLLGFLEWAMSSDASAIEYRKRFRTTVLPYAHPHALAAGYARVDPLNYVSGSTSVLRDSNRGWLDGDQTETAAKLKPKLLAHIGALGTGGRISIGADFHEFGSGSANFYWNAESYDQDMADAVTGYWQDELAGIGSDQVVRPIARTGAYLTSPAAAERALFIDAMDATWAMTPEQGPELVDSTDDLLAFGQALGRTFLRLYQAGTLPDRTSA